MKLEVFFDYACPYCRSGLGYLRGLIPAYPELELVWRPCEAHPRPERYGVHSDLALRGLLFALENGVDAWAYHDRIFRAVFDERKNIENPKVFIGCIEGLDISAAGFGRMLESDRFIAELDKCNRYAWGESRLFAVPSYKLNGKFLKSRDGRPVSQAELAEFLGRG